MPWFGSDPDLIGKPLGVNIINLDHVGPTQHTIVGIVTTDVRFPPLTADFQLGASGIDETVDFWTPVSFSTTAREGRELDVIARLRPGVTVVQAQAEMDTIAQGQCCRSQRRTAAGIGRRRYDRARKRIPGRFWLERWHCGLFLAVGISF